MKQKTKQIVHPQMFVQREHVIPYDHCARYCSAVVLVEFHKSFPTYRHLTGRHGIINWWLHCYLLLIFNILLLFFPKKEMYFSSSQLKSREKKIFLPLLSNIISTNNDIIDNIIRRNNISNVISFTV